MSELISRDDAIKALLELHVETGVKTANAIRILRELPAASAPWIPVKTRPMDEEEKRYWEEHYDYTFGEDYDGIMFDCPMPEDGQEVWVCSKCGNVWQDTCEVDAGIFLEDNGDWDDIVAWMPFKRPEPWRGEADAETDDPSHPFVDDVMMGGERRNRRGKNRCFQFEPRKENE